MKFSRFFALVIVFLLSAGMALANFDDVLEGHEHYAAILWMEGRSVIQGYEDGTFRPDQEVNRAEALKIILLASDVEVDEAIEETEDLFPDVTTGDWYYPYVAKGLDLGIVEGYDDGYFRPEQTINLAETLKIVHETRDLTVESPLEDPYWDVPMDAWFAPYVANAKDRNFIEAHDDGMLHADYTVNRGDLTEIMYRFAYVDEFEFTEFNIAMNWPEFQHETDDYMFKAPFDWYVISGSNGEVVLWHADVGNNQKNWSRTTENSAVLTIKMDWNEDGVELNEYFNAVADGLDHYEGVDTVISTTATADDYLSLLVSYEGEYQGFRDLYIQMPGETYLIVQGTYGTGLLKDQLLSYITAIQENIYYSPSPEEPVEPEPDLDETLETARANIQVDGAGQTILDLFDDRELIDTDTIGVGTGPVDYYYSAWADVTLKYERSFDVVLDIEEGQTTAF